MLNSHPPNVSHLSPVLRRQDGGRAADQEAPKDVARLIDTLADKVFSR
jgi:hypothetical protein